MLMDHFNSVYVVFDQQLQPKLLFNTKGPLLSAQGFSDMIL